MGGAIVRPLIFDNPTDSQTYSSVEETYMLGDSIKVSPVLQQGLKDGDQYNVYFPQGLWHDLNDPKQIINKSGGGGYV